MAEAGDVEELRMIQKIVDRNGPTRNLNSRQRRLFRRLKARDKALTTKMAQPTQPSFQGPVRPGTDVEHFRRTGKSIPSTPTPSTPTPTTSEGRFQGPVRPGTDVEHFRRTGQTIRRVPSVTGRRTFGRGTRVQEDFGKTEVEVKRPGTIFQSKVGEAGREGRIIPVFQILTVEEDFSTRRATEEERKQLSDIISAKELERVALAPEKTGLEGASERVSLQSEQLFTRRMRGEDISLKEEAGDFLGGLALSGIGTVQFVGGFFTHPISTIKGVGGGVSRIVTGEAARTGEFAFVSQTLRDRPSFAAGFVSGEVAQIILFKKVTSLVGTRLKVGSRIGNLKAKLKTPKGEISFVKPDPIKKNSF